MLILAWTWRMKWKEENMCKEKGKGGKTTSVWNLGSSSNIIQRFFREEIFQTSVIYKCSWSDIFRIALLHLVHMYCWNSLPHLHMYYVFSCFSQREHMTTPRCFWAFAIFDISMHVMVCRFLLLCHVCLHSGPWIFVVQYLIDKEGEPHEMTIINASWWQLLNRITFSVFLLFMSSTLGCLMAWWAPLICMGNREHCNSLQNELFVSSRLSGCHGSLNYITCFVWRSKR